MYKIIHKDPTVQLEGTRWLRPERVADIDRQIVEVVSQMTPDLVFEIGAEELAKDIDKQITAIDKEIATPVQGETTAQTKLRLERLNDKREYQVSRSRTPAQLADEKTVSLKNAAIGVLNSLHEQRMRGRVAQFQTTCRFGDCEKQPRTPKNEAKGGHKAARRTFVFCKGHGGVRSQITTADYLRLKSDKNLRVVAQ